jgi:hypothetical protein
MIIACPFHRSPDLAALTPRADVMSATPVDLLRLVEA